jgi:hypothetical protein
MTKDKSSIIFITGATFLLIGAILPIFGFRIANYALAPFIFSLGVLGVVIGRYLQPIKGDDFRMKRLRIQQLFSTCFLVLSAYLMFIEDSRWVLPLLIAAVIDLVISFRVPTSKSE